MRRVDTASSTNTNRREITVDSVAIGLMIGLGAYGGSGMAGLVGALAARGHRVGRRGRLIGFTSTGLSLALMGTATLTDPAVLPVTLAGNLGASSMGASVGLLGSELTRMARRALP